MNFLDPDEWHDLAALEKEHEELTEELVKQLHHRLKPYFLRRIKSEVLQLPPKVSSRISRITVLHIVPERSHRSSLHDAFAEKRLSFHSEYDTTVFLPVQEVTYS
jgi:hypothetical protein